MKKLIMLFIFLTINCLSAQKLIFSFDAAGNQTKREFAANNTSPSSRKAFLEEQSVVETSTKGLVIYPNPTAGLLVVDFGSDAYKSVTNYQVYNIDGALLSQGKIAEQKTTIDLTAFPSGAYVLVLNLKDRNISRKIIKK